MLAQRRERGLGAQMAAVPTNFLRGRPGYDNRREHARGQDAVAECRPGHSTRSQATSRYGVRRHDARSMSEMNSERCAALELFGLVFRLDFASDRFRASGVGRRSLIAGEVLRVVHC